MQNRNPNFGPQDPGEQGGVGVPVKGDSSTPGSNPPSDSDSPTVIDFSKADFAKPDFPKPAPDSDATYVDPDATVMDAVPLGSTPRPTPPPVRKPSRVQVSVSA